MAKNKNNPLLAKYEAMFRAKFDAQLQIAMQMGLDAGMIAANEVLGMGAGRAEKFRTAYIEAVNAWTKAKVDERIRKIVGDENFVPWEERYGGK